MTGEDEEWNPWLVKQVHPSDLLVDKFQSWDSTASKPRLKAWNRAQQWVCDIIRLPFTPPAGHGLRVSDKEKAFLYLTEEMSKSVPFIDFLKSCMIPPNTALESGSVTATVQTPSGDASSSKEVKINPNLKLLRPQLQNLVQMRKLERSVKAHGWVQNAR